MFVQQGIFLLPLLHMWGKKILRVPLVSLWVSSSCRTLSHICSWKFHVLHCGCTPILLTIFYLFQKYHALLWQFSQKSMFRSIHFCIQNDRWICPNSLLLVLMHTAGPAGELTNMNCCEPRRIIEERVPLGFVVNNKDFDSCLIIRCWCMAHICIAWWEEITQYSLKERMRSIAWVMSEFLSLPHTVSNLARITKNIKNWYQEIRHVRQNAHKKSSRI